MRSFSNLTLVTFLGILALLIIDSRAGRLVAASDHGGSVTFQDTDLVEAIRNVGLPEDDPLRGIGVDSSFPFHKLRRKRGILEFLRYVAEKREMSKRSGRYYWFNSRK